MPATPNPVVHLELLTGNLPRACAFYTRLFGWQAEQVTACAGGRYMTLDIGDAIEGGVVEREIARPLWLPYVQVCDIDAATEQARCQGARVLLGPREGPAGWRSVLAAPDGAEVALWRPK